MTVDAATPPAVLALHGARVVRGRREVLRVERLEVPPGETVALLGPNGAGKTTLLLASALLLPLAAGEVRLFGEAPRREADRVRLRRRTATVFQEHGLLDIPALANVETALALHGVPKAERRPRAEHWLARLGAAHLAKARPHTLSGGEAQRVALARAFAVRPQLLFLDEPFSSLDPATRGQLVGELHVLLAAEGTAALLATHDHGEAHLLAGRTAVLLDGTITQEGCTQCVFDRPASPEVAAFLGYSVVSGEWLRAVLGVEARPGAVAYLPPDAATLAAEGEPATLEAEVVAVEAALGDARLVVHAGERFSLRVPVERVRRESLLPGRRLPVRLDPTRILWP